MELLGRFLAVSRLNYPTPAKSLQTPQQNETPRKRGVRQQSETRLGGFFIGLAPPSSQQMSAPSPPQPPNVLVDENAPTSPGFPASYLRQEKSLRTPHLSARNNQNGGIAGM